MLNRENRSVSQVITIICAICGHHIKIDNRYESDILEFNDFNDERIDSLFLHCPNCEKSYDIPCKVNRYQL